MCDLDLHSDVEFARDELSPYIDKLIGLLQMWHMFKASEVVSKEFIDKFDNLSYQLKLACTRSLIFDYFKPWTINNSPQINTLRVYTSKKNWNYPFLNSVVNEEEHQQFKELRHSIVAHLDEDYETSAVILKGSAIKNAHESRPREKGTLKSVYLPAIVTIGGRRGFWWLSDKNKIEKLNLHIKKAIWCLDDELRLAGNQFREKCLEHMHVLHLLSDLFIFHELSSDDNELNIDEHKGKPTAITIDDPIELKIGNENITSLGTTLEPLPQILECAIVEGRGYKLEILENSENGKRDFRVSFPKYPFPKGPVA